MAKKNNTPMPEQEPETVPGSQAEEQNAQAQAPDSEPAEAAAAPSEAEEALVKLQAELAAEKDKYLRLAAEYDNFRKRSAKERENIYADVRADTVTKFLPVYDNLARALAQETADTAYQKGVEMIMTQLRSILEKLSVREIPALGETFDPARHNAVMHVEDAAFGEGEIIEEFEKGFTMGEKVIRFSMVKVAN